MSLSEVQLSRAALFNHHPPPGHCGHPFLTGAVTVVMENHGPQHQQHQQQQGDGDDRRALRRPGSLSLLLNHPADDKSQACQPTSASSLSSAPSSGMLDSHNSRSSDSSPLQSPVEPQSPLTAAASSRKAGRGRPRLYKSQKLQEISSGGIGGHTASNSSTAAATSSAASSSSSGEQQQQERSPPHAIYFDADNNPENLEAALLAELQRYDLDGQRQIINPFSELFTSQTAILFRKEVVSLIQNWTTAEKQAARKLVYFWRNNDSFRCSLTEPCGVKSTVISCIYWKKVDDYFFTSVDCLQLLEFLIGKKFNPEQKNRIRRNLEGFQPVTVSRNKQQHEDLFKTIMGFPKPKPRNIEKDVKVFLWKILSLAVIKIVSRFGSPEFPPTEIRDFRSRQETAIDQPSSSIEGDSEVAVESQSPSTLKRKKTSTNDSEPSPKRTPASSSKTFTFTSFTPKPNVSAKDFKVPQPMSRTMSTPSTPSASPSPNSSMVVPPSISPVPPSANDNHFLDFVAAAQMIPQNFQSPPHFTIPSQSNVSSLGYIPSSPAPSSQLNVSSPLRLPSLSLQIPQNQVLGTHLGGHQMSATSPLGSPTALHSPFTFSPVSTLSPLGISAVGQQSGFGVWQSHPSYNAQGIQHLARPPATQPLPFGLVFNPNEPK